MFLQFIYSFEMKISIFINNPSEFQLVKPLKHLFSVLCLSHLLINNFIPSCVWTTELFFDLVTPLLCGLIGEGYLFWGLIILRMLELPFSAVVVYLFFCSEWDENFRILGNRILRKGFLTLLISYPMECKQCFYFSIPPLEGGSPQLSEKSLYLELALLPQ